MYGKPMHFIDWLIDMPEEFSFWVEDQIAVMSPVTIAVVIVVTLAVLAGIWLLVVSAAKKDVRNTSEILAGIEEVNQGYEFYDVDEEIRLEYPLESLEEYRGASLDKLFMGTVRKKIPQFEEVFGWAQSNVIQFAAYKEELKSIPNWTEKDDDCGRKIPFWLYKHYEKKLVNAAVFGTPVTETTFIAVKQYTPHKGKTMEESKTYSMAEAKEFVRLAKAHEQERQQRENERRQASSQIKYEVLRRDRFRCVICGRTPEQGAKLHIQAVKPLPKHERPSADCFRTVCEDCMRKKG